MNYAFADFVETIVDTINLLIVPLTGIALLLFFVGIIQFIYKTGDTHAKEKGREVMVWGLIALFILTSMWGILRILKESFLPS